ncbi:S26 family signal peptidase [Natronorubrum sp. JWXQ-INN-674]|uniref:S26 family signal peptidase n=1 Tax=Natronorubrum halalkaliphilum TaxID=2691917 RepID=A0A6B0VN18_9EURY|nr:S26 family signal peptidase [Natronorubrum halalkaliphilum]MXV62990.1 S26 family signal peptidase [Natronorubrum halalkaliphilum]
MSGSSPGDPPDDPDDSDDRVRDRRDRDGRDDRTPPGDPSTAPEATTESESEAGFESGSEPQPRARSRADDVTIEDDGVVRWFLKTEDGTVVMARDVLSSVAIVAVIGLVLFGLSGVWPPLVAVESGSMEPNMERGDLIFVVDDDRYAGDNPVEGTGVVTFENGHESGHEKFGEAGDVIVFKPNGDDHQTPVIHRAQFWVEEGENWVDTKADDAVIGEATCGDVQTCPANHDGFITKGDANNGYDQYGNGISDVVRPEWVTGKAMIRVPWLGHVRLTFDEILGETGVQSPILEDNPVPVGPDSPALQAGLAGATGLAGTSAGVAVAIGRYRS